MQQVFDHTKDDVQGTEVRPMAPETFDIPAYEDYARQMDERVRAFEAADSGVLVYRRFRVPEVYSFGCRDRTNSLSLQLAALTRSMEYEADVANFLEPWYGIGAAAGAFGAEYLWNAGQAPAVAPRFSSVEEALQSDHIPIEQSSIGKTTLEYIEYFLNATAGRIPMSPGDVQSPLNAAGEIVGTDTLFLDMLDEPEQYRDFLALLTDKMVAFFTKQKKMLGGSLALPGHGFAASRELKGIGISDDNAVMISPASYVEHEVEHRRRLGDVFGGVAFHSCGNWAHLIPAVKKIPNLVCVDGAFTPATDPAPNQPEPFAAAFSASGVVLHARAVGTPEQVEQAVARLWQPPMKLIVCTYCETPEQQQDAYRRIHAVCR